MTAGLLILQYLAVTAILVMIFVLTQSWKLSHAAKSVFFTLLLIVYGLSMTLVMPLVGLVIDLGAGWAPIVFSLFYVAILLGVPLAIYTFFSRSDKGPKDSYPFPRFELTLEVVALALLSFALSLTALAGVNKRQEHLLAGVGPLFQFIIFMVFGYGTLELLAKILVMGQVSYFRGLNNYATRGRPFLHILFVVFAALSSTLLLAQYFLL